MHKDRKAAQGSWKWQEQNVSQVRPRKSRRPMWGGVQRRSRESWSRRSWAGQVLVASKKSPRHDMSTSIAIIAHRTSHHIVPSQTERRDLLFWDLLFSRFCTAVDFHISSPCRWSKSSESISGAPPLPGCVHNRDQSVNQTLVVKSFLVGIFTSDSVSLGSDLVVVFTIWFLGFHSPWERVKFERTLGLMLALLTGLSLIC